MSVEDFAQALRQAGITDATAARQWLEETVTVQKPIPSQRLLKWASLAGRAARLADASQNTALPPEVRAAAIAASSVLSNAQAEVDLSDPDQAAGLQALVQAGVLTQAEADELTQLAQVTGPRWQVEFEFDQMPEEELATIFPPSPPPKPAPDGILVQLSANVRADQQHINLVVSRAAGLRPLERLKVVRATPTRLPDDPEDRALIETVIQALSKYLQEGV